MERSLYNRWRSHIESKNQITDAASYESELRYPIPQPPLWEAVDWLYRQQEKNCRFLGLKIIRTKYIKWKKRYFGFSKMRRKTNNKRKPPTRALLHFLNKLIGFEKELRTSYKMKFVVTYLRRVATIKKVYGEEKKLKALITKEHATRLRR